MQPNVLEDCEGATLNPSARRDRRANRSFDRSNRKDFPMSNEQIIRRA
jgi:hypothetical protein